MTKEDILKNTEHRPFPLPKIPWIMQQGWEDLLFLHYKVPYDLLRSLIPKELEIDTYNDEAWISITPFKMRNVRVRLLPPIPTTYNFLELNVRTYVKLNGRGGIYFFSLDASSTLSVLGARAGAFLPYFRADMSVTERNGEFHYKSQRLGSKRTPAVLDVKYKPISPPFESSVGSFEDWIVERYCLFQHVTSERYIEIDIHHLKWPLQKADVEVISNSVAEPFGFHLSGQKPVAHYAKYLLVLVWPIKIVKSKKQPDTYTFE